MCGIVYIEDYKGKPVNNAVLEQFDAQRSRGVRGFGLFDGQEKNIIRTVTEDQILKWLVKYDSNLLMFHHRAPTSTDNTRNTAHPFTTKDFFKDTQYIMIHNGHIHNSKELRLAHGKLGIPYRSVENDGRFNDSESLLWDLALYFQGKQEAPKAKGNIAFICIELEKGELSKLHFGRNNNPIKMRKTSEGLMLSSEGEGELIESNRLYTYNYKLKRLTNKFCKFKTTYENLGDKETPKTPVPVVYRTPLDRWEEEENYETTLFRNYDYKLTESEIENLVLKYLIAGGGLYKEAYDLLEGDYQQLAEDPFTFEEMREMRMFEHAMLLMEDIPEWENDYSMSSLFTGQQMRLT